ncbi:hypothetical protein JCM6882_003674 [Rhodosporidiobolus microsporus]
MGIDTARFVVQPVPDYLICIVCFDALQDPVECCSEAHVICSSCYYDLWAAQLAKCPTCREQIQQTRPAKTLQRIIEGLETRCARHKRGCDWAGPWGNHSDHKKKCKFVSRPCPNGECDFKGIASAIDEHLDTTCEFEDVECPRGCGEVYLRSELTDHDNFCAEWPCRVRKKCPTRTTLANRTVHEKFCKDSLKAETSALAKRDVEVKKRKALEKEVETSKALKKEVEKLKKDLQRAQNVAVAAPNGPKGANQENVLPLVPGPVPSAPAAKEASPDLIGKRVSKPSLRALEASATANEVGWAGRTRGGSRSGGPDEAGPSSLAKRARME